MSFCRNYFLFLSHFAFDTPPLREKWRVAGALPCIGAQCMASAPASMHIMVFVPWGHDASCPYFAGQGSSFLYRYRVYCQTIQALLLCYIGYVSRQYRLYCMSARSENYHSQYILRTTLASPKLRSLGHGLEKVFFPFHYSRF